MNADHFKGKWNQVKDELKKTWAECTDDDLMKSEGDCDKFRRAVQKRYADRKDEVGRWTDKFRLTACALSLFVSGIPMIFPQHAAAADNELFHQMDIGFFSVGGRATYYDPQEGQSQWFGGGQVRLHPWKYLAFEGSADYRREDTAGSRIHTYPVQVSALIYPLGHTRLAPFLLGGGGWYYTTVKGPGNFDDTQNRFGLHAGGGLQFFFTNHLSIDSTYRYIWVEDIQSKDQSLQDKSFNDNGHMITVGLNLHF